MPPVNGFQLSPIQQGMLYHHLRAPQAGVDIEQMTVRLRDGVDPKALRRAWELLVNAHAAFRSSFLWNDLPEPLQVEHPKIDLEWLERDLGGLAPDARAGAIEEFLDADRRRGFDLSVPPLTRCALFRLDGKEWEFVWTFHHISADGQAYPALVREGFAAYEAIRDGRQPQFAKPPAMRDFVAWRARHWAEIRDRAEPFWRETLKGFASPTALPGSGTAKRDAAGQGMRSVALSETETAKLRAFAEAQGCTLNTLVQAAWAFLLAAYSNEDDVVFGETRACRRNTVPGAENIVGTLINTVPIRIRLNHNMRLCDWLKDLRAARSALRAFEHTPLSEIQHWSELPAKTALFDSIIVFTPRLIGAALREQGGTWAERDIEFREQTNYPLTLFAYGEGGLLLRLAYDRAQIADATAARCVEQLGTLLRGMPENSDRLLSDISLVGPDERRRLTVEWNDTARPYPMDRTIHELFEDQVARTPDAVAVAFRDQSLTYGELNECANRLAHRLQSLGAGPGKIVGIFMKRSIDLVVALLGTLKSGAAYLPLDPAFPRERISWMLEDTRAPIVVTQRGLKDAVPASAGTHILCLDDPASLDGAASSGNIARAAGPQDLAYVIFTSGSSGRPKGVMIEHRNVVNFFAGMDDSLEYREPGTWLAVTSISFDISVLELFWTLTRGFKVVVQEEAWLEGSSAGTAAAGGSGMQFSLFYFAADAGESGDNKYRLLLEGSQFADRNGFAAVWTPERHFHAFGGLYPNPSLTGAAIAATTKNVQIRAGSVVLPLHNPIRIAEEWSVVDNLSGGRVGLSFASGWHANDFALMPQNYRERKEITFRGIETVKKLWSGESVKVQSGTGAEIDVRIFPAPVQRDPPIWVTAAGSVETFRMAGELGANLLTNLLGQKAEDLTAKIAAYRAARRERGHAGEGTVTLMLHTFVGPDMDMVRQIVRRPFIEYLKTSTDLIKQARWEFPAFANAKGAKLEAPEGGELSPDEVDALMEHAFERYFQTSGLFGTPDVCLAMVDRLTAIGVNEIACLIDFGVDTNAVLENLKFLNQVRERSMSAAAGESYAIPKQIRRHGVTHFQCTPSLARVLASDAESTATLRPLRKLLLGGEALPPQLAAKLSAAIDGDLVNMYGPTETTVWSTTSRIGKDAETITIGRPIANTQVYIVDRHMNLAPVGIAGELLIGGDGVTRGYLDRADLTAERFIADRFCGKPGARLYRTGDLVRYRDSGDIEFLGRIDNQIKIRGYRIELGEIEATLASHPSVGESVAVVRDTASGERALVAYVTPAGANGAAAHWQAVWDHAYDGTNGSPPPADPTLNTAGWTSSFNGEPIPEAEMREWVERTVERIRSLKPKRILEIGCGFGMLLFRLAKSCERYHAVDFAPSAVRYVQEEAKRQGLSNIRVERGAADRLPGVENGAFDAIVLNSVIQYFPSVEYLVGVLERVVPLLAPGGSVFIGDVRSLPLLSAFHAAIELELAADDTAAAELSRRIAQRAQRDSELVLAPDFFRTLQQQIPTIRQVDIELKRGRYRNEMNCFRYDVVLRTVATPSSSAAAEPGDAATLPSIRERLAEGEAEIAIRGIPNPRVLRAARAADMLAGKHCPGTAGEIREALAALDAIGIDPEDLYMLDAPYDVHLEWSGNAPDRFDAVFRHRSKRAPERAAVAVALPPRRPWAEYANARGTTLTHAAMQFELKELAKRRLPDYMVPQTIVVLDELPRTPNGKLDRKALPDPGRDRIASTAAYAAPQSEIEKTIADVWKELLNLERVGANDNFFDLGANSLIMMQANVRLRSALRRELTLVDLFRYPTVSALAAHLGSAIGDKSKLDQSQQRGQARLDALRRRRAEPRR